jgi:hypothetical protein
VTANSAGQAAVGARDATLAAVALVTGSHAVPFAAMYMPVQAAATLHSLAGIGRHARTQVMPRSRLRWRIAGPTISCEQYSVFSP